MQCKFEVEMLSRIDRFHDIVGSNVSQVQKCIVRQDCRVYHNVRLGHLEPFEIISKLGSIWDHFRPFGRILKSGLLYRDLSYGEILVGRPGAWLVKKIFFICMQSQNFKKDLILKFFDSFNGL